MQRGGKLLMFGGWNDSAIPPTANTEYYESVQRRMGMGHCPGPAFGGRTTYEFDPLELLVDWHQHGTPPAKIIARRVVEGHTERELLVCPSPQIAVASQCRGS